MSLSARIDLENEIFARAAQLNTAVDAKYGGLISPAHDWKLQMLICVYNTSFRAENWRTFCSPDESLQARRAYIAGCTYTPGRGSMWGSQDFNFELLLGEEP